MLSAILRYGCHTYPVLQTNPLAALTSGYVKVMQKIEKRRDCLIYDSEEQRNDFKVFYDAIQQTTEIQRDMYLLALYTGMRRGEVESLRWEHVDLQRSKVEIPDTKNRHPLIIPLNRQSMEILNRRRGIVDDSSPWVFAPETPAFNNKIGHSTMRPAALRKCTGLKMTIHGLRRTFSTVGRKLKRFEDTSRLTNHVDSSVEGVHYDETTFKDLRESSQLIADTIERYMKESTDNVIQFPGMARAA